MIRLGRSAVLLGALAVALAACKQKETPPAPAPAPAPPPDAAPPDAAPPDAAVALAPVPVPSPPPGDGFALAYVPPAAGQVIDVSDDISTTGGAVVNGRQLTFLDERTLSWKETLVTVKGDVVTQLAVSFGGARAQRAKGGKAQRQDLPVADKTYVFTIDRGGVTAVTADGGAVPDLELAELSAFRDDLGRPDRLAALIASKRWQKGQPVALTGDEIGAIAPPDRGLTATGVTMTLVELNPRTVTFALDATYTGQLGTFAITVTARGSAVVDRARGRAITLEVSGDIHGTGKAEFTGRLVRKKSLGYRD